MVIGFDEAMLVYEMAHFKPTKFSGFDSTKAVAFSPASPYLAAANIRGWINVWNSTTNRQVATIKMIGAKMGRNNLAFSADGGRLVASQFKSIQIWDLTQAAEKTVLAGHEGAIPCAVYRPHGGLLATGGKDDQVRFWNPQTGQMIDSIDIGEAVQTLAFTKDGRTLAVGSMGRAGAPHLRLLDVDSRKVTYEAAPAMGEVYSLAWAETADSRYLAVCGNLGVGLWKAPLSDPTNMEQVYEVQRPFCLATVIDPQARFMVWVENERQLKAWDIPTSRELPLHAPEMQQGWHGLTLLPDGESMIYVSNAGLAETWNVRADRRVGAFGKAQTFAAPHLALSPNGRWFAALTAPDTVSVWDRPNGRHIFSLRPESCTVWSLAWDPSSKNLTVGRSDGDLAIWRLPEIQDKLAEAGLPWEDFD
jgi:WD40 repeat protein